MDLGIKGRKAIVCAASKGIGRAAAESLAAEGVDLTIMARTLETLHEAAAGIRSTFGVKVTTVVGDVTTEEARDELFSACPSPDILVCNPGLRQTPADFRTLSREDWLKWWDAHFYSTIDLITRAVPGMSERRFGRVVNVSVSNIKFPQLNFAHSHSARVALSGAIASMVRELIGRNVTINTIGPGFIDTDALHTNLHAHAARGGTTYEAIVEDRLKTTPAGRFAAPSECGDLIAYLCSAQAGFMTGQNIINDGGVYQGIF
jgi:3-oxoacyl-[acyl-carrier protein] reductase